VRLSLIFARSFILLLGLFIARVGGVVPETSLAFTPALAITRRFFVDGYGH